jgi:hypothetical protein
VIWVENALRKLGIADARLVSGVRAAIDSKIRTGHVPGLRTRDERDQRRHLVNMSIAIQRRDCLLRYRPIARGGTSLPHP